MLQIILRLTTSTKKWEQIDLLLTHVAGQVAAQKSQHGLDFIGADHRASGDLVQQRTNLSMPVMFGGQPCERIGEERRWNIRDDADSTHINVSLK